MTYRSLLDYCPTEENLELEILRIARRLKIFTADNLHVLDPSLEKLGLDRRFYGGALVRLSHQGKIKRLDYVLSGRDTCHNRPVAQWQFVETCFKRQADQLTNELSKVTEKATT